MKIINLVAENFKKLKAIDITPDSNIVEITGKCEQGKTTVLDSIKSALCGTKWDEPVRQGADKGKVVVDLGDKIITRTFTKSGGTLTVASKDGAKYPSPQSLLNDLIGKIAFDPLAFSREKDSKKQVDMLLQVVDIKVDLEHLKTISGVVVQEADNPLDILSTAYKAVYEERTIANRQLSAADKALESMPIVPETKAVSAVKLMAEKERLQAINRDNKIQRDNLENHSRHVSRLQSESVDIEHEIEKLLLLLKDERHKLEQKQAEIKVVEKTHKELVDTVALLEDEDLTDINKRITDADETNHKAQQFIDRQAKQAEVNKFQAESDGLNLKLQKIVEYKTEIMEKAKFPIAGLGFTSKGVTFEGKPFSQASTAQKMKVGIGIGMAGNPELRVIMLDGYESLDKDQRKIVEEMAAEHDFQVWCTTVSDEGVGIYIEDGEIKAVAE